MLEVDEKPGKNYLVNGKVRPLFLSGTFAERPCNTIWVKIYY